MRQKNVVLLKKVLKISHTKRKMTQRIGTINLVKHIGLNLDYVAKSFPQNHLIEHCMISF